MTETPAPVPPEAVQVVRDFLAAGLRHDESAMRACLTRRTLEGGQLNTAGPQAMSFVLGEPRMEGEVAVIPVRNIPEGGTADSLEAMLMECLVVKEDGQWKFDLSGSVDRLLGGSLETVVKELGSAMAGAMGGISKAMAEGLSQAFGGPAETAAPEEKPPGPPALPQEQLGKDGKGRRRGKKA